MVEPEPESAMSHPAFALDTEEKPDPVSDGWQWVRDAAAKLPLERSEQFVRTLEQIVEIITIQRPDLVRSTSRASRTSGERDPS